MRVFSRNCLLDAKSDVYYHPKNLENGLPTNKNTFIAKGRITKGSVSSTEVEESKSLVL